MVGKRVRRRRAVIGAASSAVIVVLAGCGTSEPFPYGSASRSGSRIEVAAPAVLDALAATNAEETARLAMRVEMTGIPGEDSFVMTADGLMTLDGEQLEMTAKVDAGDDSVEMAMRGISGVVYMKMSDVPGAPDGWMKIDASQFGAGAGTLGTASDPSEFLDYLYAVADSVQEVGREEVHGAQTTHYFALLDLTNMPDDDTVPPEVRDQLLEEIASLGFALPPIPADIWIDDDGRLRKMQLVMDFSDMLGGFGSLGGDDMPNITMTMSMELSDFGVAVDVQPPPADEIIPFNEALLGSGVAA
jgi:hypothetical protein